MMLALMLALSAYAPQTAGKGPLQDAELEKRALVVGHTIRCAVCQGLSVADSPSPMAQAMLDRVRELVSEGKNDDEIRAYFVERYGEWILLEPKAAGLNWLVWLLPFAFVGVGLYVISRKKYAAVASSPRVDAPTANPEDPYLQAVRDEVDP
jgi:cytochrome c-type biogenesis protein CcmH